MPQDRPTSSELFSAVRDFLATDLLPSAQGATAFNLRVAINVLGILERELTLGPALDAEELSRVSALLGKDGLGKDGLSQAASLAELNRELCRRIRSGELSITDPALRAHLVATTKAKLQVANPGYSE